jgi:uncharacterized protein YnzC (UPF0291/DUF896 family)
MASTTDTELTILSRLIRPERRNFSAAAARAILKIDFEPGDIERMNELADKARRGNLTRSEKAAIDGYELVGHLLALLHAKARNTLSERSRVQSRSVRG